MSSATFDTLHWLSVHCIGGSQVRDAPGRKVIATQSSPLLAANPNIVRHDQDDDDNDNDDGEDDDDDDNYYTTESFAM